MEDVKPWLQKAQRIPSRINAKQNTHILARRIIFKFLKTKDEVKILKAAKEKRHIICRSRDINQSRLLVRNLASQRTMNDIFKMLREKKKKLIQETKRILNNKGSGLQEERKIVYTPNVRTPKYVKQTLTELKREIDNNIITAEDVSILLSIMDRIFRQKISKETLDLDCNGNKVIYRTFHPTEAEYSFFSRACRTFFRIDSILGYKSSLQIVKTEIIPSIYSNQME